MSFDFEHKFNNNINLSSNSVGSINKVNNMFQNQIYESVEEIDYSSDFGISESDINWEDNLKKGEEEIDKATEEAKRLRREEEERNRRREQKRQEVLEEVINEVNTDGATLDEVEAAISLYEKYAMTDEDKAVLEQLYGLRDQLVHMEEQQVFSKKANEALNALQDGATKEEIDTALDALRKLDSTPEIEDLISSLEDTKSQMEEREKKMAELEQLYVDRDNNNGFFHPKKEEKIENKIAKLEKELGVPHKPDGWEKFTSDPLGYVGQTAVTFVVSVAEGIVDVGETIIDGAVQIGGGLISYGVSAFDPEAGKAMQEGIQDFVEFDASGTAYDSFVQASGMDPDIAYGWAHTAGNVTGQVVGYAAITVCTGGAGAAVLGGLAAAGSTAETAYANGASFNEAMLASSVSGVAGAVAGGAMDKVGTLAKGATSLKGVVVQTAKGAAIGAAEPIINTTAEYLTYGNNDGSSYLEYMDKTGGWQKVAMGAAAGGVSTGSQAVKSYAGVEKYKKITINDQSLKDAENLKWKQARESYDAVNGKGSFDKLSDASKKTEVSKVSFTDEQLADIRKASTEKIEEHINNTIGNVADDYKLGKYKGKYTVGDILSDFKGDQTKYWSEAALADYYNEFLKGADPDGNVKVYMFQNNAPGARNYKTFGGSLGPNDGAFVMSEDAYNKLINDPTIFDSSGKVINPEKLGERLGGVDFGGSTDIVAIEQTVNINDVKVPNGGYSAAFPGYWSPGGKTVDTSTGRGGVTEAVIRQGNIKDSGAKVIQH